MLDGDGRYGEKLSRDGDTECKTSLGAGFAIFNSVQGMPP